MTGLNQTDQQEWFTACEITPDQYGAGAAPSVSQTAQCWEYHYDEPWPGPAVVTGITPADMPAIETKLPKMVWYALTAAGVLLAFQLLK